MEDECRRPDVGHSNPVLSLLDGFAFHNLPAVQGIILGAGLEVVGMIESMRRDTKAAQYHLLRANHTKRSSETITSDDLDRSLHRCNHDRRHNLDDSHPVFVDDMNCHIHSDHPGTLCLARIGCLKGVLAVSCS